MLPVKSHSELLAKQYRLSCFQSHHPGHHLTSQPAPARYMKGTLSKFDRDVGPLCGGGISEVEQYRSALRTLHSEAVVDAKSNFVPNRVLGTTLPELLSFECFVRTTLAQLRSGHCQLLNSYKARITGGVTDVCPDCGVAPHSVKHLFQCPACPTQLTTRDVWPRCGGRFSQARRQSDERGKLWATTTATTTAVKLKSTSKPKSNQYIGLIKCTVSV